MTERSNKKKYPLCAAALALAVLLAGCAPAEGAAAATAQPTAEPTEAPTPTPEPETNPLTGEQGDYTNQRPVAVSIRTGDGSTPQWGIAAADVLIEGVTEGKTAGLTAVFASVDSVEKAGPVAPGRDLPLQLVLPLNAVPVHINKSVYASNLLNVLQYQDLDGYHAGTAGFAFDEDRANSGYREENCWYTTKDLINTGLATYNTDTAGANMPLFHFVQRKDPEQQNAKSLYITFSNKDTEELVYSPEVGLYLKNNADGSPMMDAGNNEQAAFTNVFVLYASSGVKDDGVTRQYDLTGGTGIYLTKGGWETIQWTKGDATAPLQLTDASGKTLDVNPGKSFLAIWGGYYGQALHLLDGDGNEQALPEKPALLDSAVPDEAAEAAKLETPKAEPVKVEDTPLSPEEQKMVNDFAEKIDITNSQMVLQYGAASQKKLSDFSETALSRVKTKDMGETGELITSLISELQGFDATAEQPKGFLGLFKKAGNNLEQLKTRYESADKNVERIKAQLEDHQVTLMKDITMLDKMYELNLVYFKELTMYILAGKKKLEQVRNTDLKAAQEKAQRTQLPEDAQAARDLADQCERFEKKLYDLELTRNISLQMGPQIRLLQNNNTMMAEKIQSTIVNTIPLWKNQMVLALGLAHSQQAMQAERAVTDMTNELLKKNADALRMGTLETAKESQRGVVDIETLQQTNKSLIETLDELNKIQTEGRAKRAAAEQELTRIEDELRAKMMEIRS